MYGFANSKVSVDHRFGNEIFTRVGGHPLHSRSNASLRNNPLRHPAEASPVAGYHLAPSVPAPNGSAHLSCFASGD